VVVFDNAKSVVTQPDWYDPELNPRIVEFCRHYGFVLQPTRPRTPRHKGQVERGVGYVKSNSLRGREFESLAAQNEHLREWERTVADTRIHGTTKRHVGQVFENEERVALRPLPAERFPMFQEGPRRNELKTSQRGPRECRCQAQTHPIITPFHRNPPAGFEAPPSGRF
ncbi:MAG: hypothetical protein ACKO3P_16860, partial [Planctomycetaceae bacterium]